MSERERLESMNALALAETILARDLQDPLWPSLTESDWAEDAKLLAHAAGWDNLRRDIATEAIGRLDAALAAVSALPLEAGDT